MDRMSRSFFISFFIFFLFFVLGPLVSAKMRVEDRPIEWAKVFKVHMSFDSSSQKIEMNDYFVDKGIRSGLIPGYLVNIYRKIELFQKDKRGALMFQDLLVPVGEARVIYSGKDVGLIRPYKIYDDQEGPSLFYQAIMLGDFLDLSSLRPFKIRVGTVQKRRTQKRLRHSILKNPFQTVIPRWSYGTFNEKKSYGTLNEKKSYGTLNEKKSYGTLNQKKTDEEEYEKWKKRFLSKKKTNERFSPEKNFSVSRGLNLVDQNLDGTYNWWEVPSESETQNSNPVEDHEEVSKAPHSMDLLPDSLLGSFDRSFYEK